MSFKTIAIFLFIHLLVPLTGLTLYLRLLKKLRKESLVNTLGIYFFIIFATYGGLLMVVLIALFWQWSGMASLGTFYLLLAAPILMAVTAYNNSKLKSLSKYHQVAFEVALLYFAILPLILLIIYYFEVSSV